jgi:translocation and assembly module TamB
MTARRIAIWAGGVVLGLILLLGIVLIGLNTDPGRRFIADRIAGFSTQSGLRFQVGRIDGSIYGKMVLRGVRISDTNGVFATAPRIEIDWRPFAYLNNHIDVRSAVAPLITVSRLPALKPVPTEPNAPILPNIDIDIGRLKIDRLVLEPPVSGQRRIVTIEGNAKIADRRAQVRADAAVLGGGDRLKLMLDAVPDDNRLAIDARLSAPAGGVIAGMAGLKAPLQAQIGGRGSWQAWKGRLTATLGSQSLADLALTARDGTFSLRGPTHPGLIVPAAARITAPALNVDLTAALNKRIADTKLALRSDALAVDAAGEVDLAHSRFGAFRIDARLVRPASIAPNLSGRNVRLAMILDGPFARPAVDYRLTADAIGFNATTVERLVATGRARVNSDRILIPVSARAARVTGLSPSVGGLLTNVSIDGQLAISGDTILSDNLRIRSPQIDATAVVVADLSSGTYRAGLKGRVNNYLVQGVGIIGLSTDVNLVATPAGGFALTGRFAAESVRIDNNSVRNLLGGHTIVTGRLAYGDGGVVRITRLRLAAPKLKIGDGGGTYRPDGRIDFRATGVSDDYGPLTVFVTGTAARPQIRIRASRPNIGVPLSNVDAVIRSTGNGYAITATGGSPYGPFSADLFVATGGGGPLAVDIRRAHFAGIDFKGRVTQTRAGPFAGQLSLAGSGFTGTVRLGAQGSVQTAQISARAVDATIPSDPPIHIGRAIVEARLILYASAPLIVADIQAAGVRQGQMLVQTARARINYQGGRGTAELVAKGRSGATFEIAARADLSPGLYRVAAQGTVNSIAFHLARPAMIRAERGGYALDPATIVLPQGELRLTGRYGPGIEMRARFDNLDLSVLNAFAAGAGVGGKATGSLDFAQTGNAFPRADLRLGVDNFTRSGAAVVSEPVDLAVLGTLRPEGGDLRAVIRRGGQAIGRLQARLQPVAAGGGWTSRLLAAPLSGGIRYNGPASVLWSLTGIADQQLTGPVGVAADFGGRLDQPQLTGVIRANALGYVNETYGTRIRNIRLSGRFTNDRLEIGEFTGQAGEGTITGRGSIGLSAAAGYPIDVRATLDHARLARSDALGATATGTIQLTNSKAGGATISGDLRLPEVRYQIVRQGAAEVAVLEGVRRKGSPPPSTEPDAPPPLPGLFKLDLRLRADNQVFVSGMGLESEWSTDLRVTGTSAAPRLVGRLDVVRGTYSFAGRRFDLDDNSHVTFEGDTNPLLDIRATGDVSDTEITIVIGGRAQNPQISFSSNPQLPQDELLSRALFGESISSISAIQAVQLAAALNSLRGGGGGLNPLGKLRSVAGIDRLRILGADETTGRGTAVAAGTYISNRIYVEIITDARGFTATQINIALSKAFSILSQTSSFSGTSVELRYRKDY